VGADPACSAGGFGLLGMRERVLDWGGQFQIESSLGQGFKIEIDLPIKVQNDA
jgi:signal transduction histidine kinase